MIKRVLKIYLLMILYIVDMICIIIAYPIHKLADFIHKESDETIISKYNKIDIFKRCKDKKSMISILNNPILKENIEEAHKNNKYCALCDLPCYHESPMGITITVYKSTDHQVFLEDYFLHYSCYKNREDYNNWQGRINNRYKRRKEVISRLFPSIFRKIIKFITFGVI